MNENTKKLIRIYTPFIFASAALINGVLYVNEYQGILYRVFSELMGNSILAILYLIVTSKRMCKWYKYTNYLLLTMHIPTTLYYFYIFVFKDAMVVFYAMIVLSILALITFLIYRVSVGITKILC